MQGSGIGSTRNGGKGATETLQRCHFHPVQRPLAWL